MKAEEVIRMWKQGYSKKKIVEQYLEDYSRKVLAHSNFKKKPSMNQLKEESQRDVEQILLNWWKREVLEKR